MTAVVSTTVVVILLAALVPSMEDAATEDLHDDALHVFVITGQSNAAYFHADLTTANELPHISPGLAYYYGTSSSPILYGPNVDEPTYDASFEPYALHDVVNSEGDYVIGGLESAFISEYVNKTQNKALIINTAIGGQTIEQMQPDGVGNTYAKNVFDHATALIPSDEKIVYDAILFIQGESNASTSVDAYKIAFVSMADSYLEFTKCNKIVLSKVRAINAPNPSTAQIELCEEYSKFVMGSTAADSFTTANGLLRSDNLHYTQAGKNIIGPQLAIACIDHNSGTTFNLIHVTIGIIVICAILACIRLFIPRSND